MHINFYIDIRISIYMKHTLLLITLLIIMLYSIYYTLTTNRWSRWTRDEKYFVSLLIWSSDTLKTLKIDAIHKYDTDLLLRNEIRKRIACPRSWYDKNLKKNFNSIYLGKRMHFLQDVFQMTVIVLVLIIIIIIIMSCRRHRYPWPSLATSPDHSSPLVGPQDYIP